MPPIKSTRPPFDYDYYIKNQIVKFTPTDKLNGFPERRAWCKAFADEAQRIAAVMEADGRELLGWHELGADNWLKCAEVANVADLNNAPVVGVQKEKGKSISGRVIWSRQN